MTLLDTFILSFGTEGLEKIQKDIEKTEQKVDSLEKEEAELNETIKKGGKDAEDAQKRLEEVNKELSNAKQKLQELKGSTGGVILKFKEAAAAGAKLLGAFVGLKKLSDLTTDFAENANEMAEAAKAAGMSIEEYQNKEFRGYTLFTRADVNNAKEYEMIMRDIRMGGAAITNNIARTFLPALIQVGKVIKKVTDFFVEHGTLVKTVFFLIGGIITAYMIPTIIRLGLVFLTSLAPITLIIAAIGLIALAIEDLIVWINGGESAFGDLWAEIFGNAEGAKKFFNELKELWDQLWEQIKPALIWLAQFLGQTILFLLEKIVKGIGWLVEKVRALKAVMDSASEQNIENVDGSHAGGLDYVPFDGYLARLHKGERIQTASEANDWRSGLMAAKKAINFTASYPLNAIPQGTISNAYNNAVTNDYNNSTSSKSITIGDITIQTQATDAQGIAGDIASYIKQAVISLDDGMLA